MKNRRFISIVLMLTLIISALVFIKSDVTAAGGEWKQEKDQRWWYKYSDGSYAKDEYIDGYWLNGDGQYTGN